MKIYRSLIVAARDLAPVMCGPVTVQCTESAYSWVHCLDAPDFWHWQDIDCTGVWHA